MRSLNRSLPPDTTVAKPTEAVLQAFRDAALSVTKLYKEASSSQQRERQAGYQDALDELLTFLDKENLGLGDGEGWRVRQWATERLAGSAAAGNDASESDDDKESVKHGDGGTNTGADAKDVPESSPVPELRESLPSAFVQPSTTSAHPPNTTPPKSDAFTFRSEMSYPRDVEMNTQDSNSSNSSPPEQHALLLPQPPLRPRRARHNHNSNSTSHRHDRHGHRANANRRLGQGVGSKRKLDFGDFFDFANLPDGKDGSGGAGCGGGGGKRGRTS